MIHRLPVSALFSVAIHALFMFLMAGVVFFPAIIIKPITQLEVILASHPEDVSSKRALLEADSHQKGEHTAQRAPLKGNAQWTYSASIANQAAQARFDNKPLRYRTVSAATHQARDAAYLARWRQRVETYGTRYYQSKMKQTPVSGEVRILVSIGTQGELLNAVVRQSSGEPRLDALAIEILKKTAPFEPLPEEMLADTDVLEIIRTWKFTAKEGLRSR